MIHSVSNWLILSRCGGRWRNRGAIHSRRREILSFLVSVQNSNIMLNVIQCVTECMNSKHTFYISIPHSSCVRWRASQSKLKPCNWLAIQTNTPVIDCNYTSDPLPSPLQFGPRRSSSTTGQVNLPLCDWFVVGQWWSPESTWLIIEWHCWQEQEQ